MTTGILVAIFGLGLLIFVHEFGHFIVGRLMGLEITEFMIGLPVGPTLLSFKRGGIKYGIRALLFGGYVKFTEIFPGDRPEIEKVLPQSPALSAGLAKGDLIMALDNRVTESWDDVRETISALQIGQSVPAKIRRGAGDLVLEVIVGERHGLPWLGAGPMASDNVSIETWPRTLEAQSFWRKGLVVAAGPLMNLVLAVAVMAGAFTVGLASPTNVIGQVLPGSPAANVGLWAGDRIVAIDGRPTPSWRKVMRVIAGRPGRPITVRVWRDGRRLTFHPTLRGARAHGLLGVVTAMKRQPRGLGAALRETYKLLLIYFKGIIRLLGQLFSAPGKLAGQLRSPIGVVGETAPIAQYDLVQYFVVLAGFSFAIAVFNLLPLPPLDGGRIFIWLVERLARRPFPRAVLAFINVVGVTLLLILLVYVAAGDIVRLTTPGGG